MTAEHLRRIASSAPARWTGAGLVALSAAVVLAALSALAGPLAPLALGVALGGLLLAWLKPAWSLGLAVALAPLEGIQVPVAGIGGLSPAEGALLLVAAGWVLRALTGTGPIAWPRPADWPVASLILLVSPGLVFGSDRILIIRIMVFWSAFALAGLTARALTSRERLGVLLALGVGAGLLGLEGVQTYVSGGGAVVSAGGTYGRASAGIPDPNYYGGYLQLAAVPVLALAVVLKGRARALALACVAACSAGIVLSLSRGATLALFLAGALVLMAWSRSRRLTVVAGVAALAGLAANLGPLLSSPLAQSVGARLASSGDVGSNNDRITLWRFALKLIVDHPLGVGSGRFETYSARAGLTVRTEPFQQAHNVYLNMAAEMGVLALFVFLCWLVVIGYDTRDGLRRTTGVDYAVAVGVGAAMVGFAFQALTVTLYQVQIIQGTFFVLAGLLSGLPTERRGVGAVAPPDQAEETPVRRAASSNSTSGRSTAAW